MATLQAWIPQISHLKKIIIGGLFAFGIVIYQVEVGQGGTGLLSPNRLTIPDDCECEGENFCFPGLNDTLGREYGRVFPCEHYKYIKTFHLTETDINGLKSNAIDEINDDWTPVFGSAASSDHFGELRAMVMDIRKRIAAAKIIIYDVGLEEEQVEEIKSWCDVEYRLFNFKKYPPHLRHLKNYAFKLVIAEILQTEKNFFFYDSSIRLLDDVHKIIPKAVKEGRILPFMNFNSAKHSVYATIHDGMLDYLPLPKEVLFADELQSILFISDSPYTRRFIRWFLLCALTKDCISPRGASTICDLSSRDRIHHKMGKKCHRFDQNLWNMIQLEYLFDPEDQGAVKLKLADEWVNDEEFIKRVIKKRKELWNPLGSKFSIRRSHKISKPIEVACKEKV